ncbi:hypothetical protein PIB30_046226 [Stylosanthes scabra]|uniref:Uncharacterized protein n=1 Tax=Stylosanthes scabra TaxID=79078 RepID=A0ABU6SG93_9FABA|nr:hypothetical protein [Stylosanthes scabra]
MRIRFRVGNTRGSTGQRVGWVNRFELAAWVYPDESKPLILNENLTVAEIRRDGMRMGDVAQSRTSTSGDSTVPEGSGESVEDDERSSFWRRVEERPVSD